MNTIPERIIPLISDTESKPTAAMRQAIANAEVGDEQRGEDPTVNKLQAGQAALNTCFAWRGHQRARPRFM